MSDTSSSESPLAVNATAPTPSLGSLAQKVGAEAVGTFALVFAGCGGALLSAWHGTGVLCRCVANAAQRFARFLV